MPETENRPLNIICLATYFKGADFIRECKAHGCRVILVTKEKVLREDWPREILDERQCRRGEDALGSLDSGCR